MRYHHTKNKGDLGVVEAMADLARKGWSIFVPLTEHEAFDVAAYRDGRFLRVQVKYRAAVSGVIKFPLSSVWADRKGNHVVPMNRSSIDVISIYCPNTQHCYYVDPKECGVWICLRIEPTRNSQAKGVTWAKDFIEIPPTVLGVAAGFSTPLERKPLVSHSREPRAVLLTSAHSLVG